MKTKTRLGTLSSIQIPRLEVRIAIATNTIAQGDTRPMAGNAEAMVDLRRILVERDQLYGKADAVLDTSAKNFEESLAALHTIVLEARRGAASTAL